MYAYLFEARSIQQYIIETGKIKDMIGASLIVDELCQCDGKGDLLQSVLNELLLDESKIRFSRRAGGAFVALLVNKADAEGLRALWTLTVSHFAPGMEWVDALAEGTSDAEAVGIGFGKLAQRRNRPAAMMPEAGPFVQRSQRTGRAAFKSDDKDWLDLPTWRKRKQNSEADGIAQHFLKEGAEPYAWVQNLDASLNKGKDRAMPFADSEKMLGVIHADGNGLGIALQELQLASKERQDYQDIYWKFSKALATATKKAVQAATEEVLIPQRVEYKSGRFILPARPLVLGGDDLTIIVRGDLALDFMAEFIRHFEIESERELSKVGVDSLKKKLTACGGVAFIRVGQPFVQAYALAESLCTYAKQQSARNPTGIKASSVAFYRVSTSHIGEYPEILETAESTRYGDTTYQMSLGAYSVKPEADVPLPELEDLIGLYKLLQKIPGTAERELLTVMQQAPHLAEQKYQRWREVLEKRDRQKLTAFDDVMQRLGVSDKQLPFSGKTGEALRATPLGDVFALQAVLSKGEKHDQTNIENPS